MPATIDDLRPVLAHGMYGEALETIIIELARMLFLHVQQTAVEALPEPAHDSGNRPVAVLEGRSSDIPPYRTDSPAHGDIQDAVVARIEAVLVNESRTRVAAVSALPPSIRIRAPVTDLSELRDVQALAQSTFLTLDPPHDIMVESAVENEAKAVESSDPQWWVFVPMAVLAALFTVSSWNERYAQAQVAMVAGQLRRLRADCKVCNFSTSQQDV